MFFEAVGLGAVVVCCLKGRWVRGLVLLAVGIAVMAAVIVVSDALASGGPYLLGGVAFAAVGFALALPAAEPGSWWDRFSAVDARGKRLITAQPRSQRMRRGLLGIRLGLIPGAVSFGIGAAVAGDSEAMLSIGVLSIGLMLLGAVARGIIGYNTVPRAAPTTETGGELQPS